VSREWQIRVSGSDKDGWYATLESGATVMQPGWRSYSRDKVIKRAKKYYETNLKPSEDYSQEVIPL